MSLSVRIKKEMKYAFWISMESGEPPALDQIGLKDDTKKLYRLLEQILLFDS